MIIHRILQICLVFEVAYAAFYSVIEANLPVYPSASIQNDCIASLAIGEIVVGHATGDWITLRLPFAGYISLTSPAGKSTLQSILPGGGGMGHICHQVQSGSRGDRAFWAGNNTLCSCTASDQLSWMHQWPVGSGGIGALVGGNLNAEIVPISRADYFVIQRRFLNSRFEDEAKPSDSIHSVMHAMREHQLAGRAVEARHSSDKLPRGSEGRFEFISDIAIAFSDSKATSFNFNPEGPRELVLRQLMEELAHTKGVSNPGKFGPSVGLQVSHLHMAEGAATASYVSADGLSVHHRRWVSTPSGVLHGVLRCESTEDSDKEGCLNVGIQLSRTSHKREGETIATHIYNRGKFRHSAEDSHEVGYKIAVNIGPTAKMVAPHAVLCVAIVCAARPEGHLNEAKTFRHHSTESKFSPCDTAMT
jgi:hypothetical protein